MLSANFFRQIWVLTVEELRELVLRKRAMLSLLMYFFALAVSIWLILRLSLVVEVDFSRIDLNLPQFKPLRELLSKTGLLPYANSLFQLSSCPALLWIFQMFSVLWLPSLVALVSCDMVAIDIYRGTLRFLLLRTSRLAYFVSKLLSHALLYLVLHAASILAVIAVSLYYSSQFSLVATLLLALKYLLTIFPFILFVVAATLWVSCWSRGPMGAIIKLHVLWLLVIIVSAYAPAWTPFDFNLLVGMFVPFENYPIISVAGYLFWTLCISTVSWLGFAWRDL